MWTARDTEDLNLTHHNCFPGHTAWSSLALSPGRAWRLRQPLFVTETAGHHPQKSWFSLSGLYDLASVLFKGSPLIIMRNRVTNHGRGQSPWALPAEEWHSPSASARIRSHGAETADLRHVLTGVWGRDQEPVTLCSREHWQNRPSDGCVFRRRFYEPSFLHLLISRKALRSLMETPPPVTSSHLLPKCVLACSHPLFTRVQYNNWSLPYLLEHFARTIRNAVSLARVLALPQRKQYARSEGRL